MKRLRLLCGLVILWATPASADPFTINILNATHTVTLRTGISTGLQGPTVITLYTTTSNDVPVSDNLEFPSRQNDEIDFTRASADLFEVTAATRTHLSDLVNAQATATTDMTFTPVSSGTATLALLFRPDGFQHFTGSIVRLVDLTTALEIWSYGWVYHDEDVPSYAKTGTPINVNTAFDASHVYQLSLSALASSSSDEESIATTVSGLKPVPEPATLLLVAMGAGGAVLTRRRRMP